MVTDVFLPSKHNTTDPATANHLNYLAWKANHIQRTREMRTQFSLFQGRSAMRMYRNIQLRESLNQDTPRLDELIDTCEQRLRGACDCETCCKEQSSRRRSLSDGESLRSSQSRGSMTSLSSLREGDLERDVDGAEASPRRMASPGSGQLKDLPKSKSARGSRAGKSSLQVRSVATPVS